MFSRLFNLSRRLPTVEEWANRNADITTPDMIIAAAIVESFAKDFDAWVATDLKHVRRPYYEYKPRLINEAKKLTIEFGIREWHTGDYNERNVDWQSAGTKVNGVKVELKAARLIATAYERLLKQQQRLKDTAAKAKAAMERNEQAWDIVETLLGMKRNEHGALVPVETAE